MPFALRWLAAQLPGLLGRHAYSVDELYKLLEIRTRWVGGWVLPRGW